MNAFTIKDIENLSGIKAHTIRIWEQRYSFLKAQRTETNIRYYDSKQLGAILNIALLNKYGFKISRINKMSEEEIREKILLLTQGQAYEDRIVYDLISKMTDIDLIGFEQVLHEYIIPKVIEKTILQIIFSFLERIGILWQTNHINPAQEHFVTNIIRQKLIVGIDKVKSNIESHKSVLLFLPSGEHHELGLLFVHYLLKSRGVQALYIGADIPFKDVETVAKLKQPNYIYTHLTSVSNSFNLSKFISVFCEKLPGYTMVVSGLITQSFKAKTPENIFLKQTLSEVMDFVHTI